MAQILAKYIFQLLFNVIGQASQAPLEWLWAIPNVKATLKEENSSFFNNSGKRDKPNPEPSKQELGLLGQAH